MSCVSFNYFTKALSKFFKERFVEIGGKIILQDFFMMGDKDFSAQIARLKKRNGLSRAEALRRIKSQMPLAEKRCRADYVLNGTLPLPQLKQQVRLLYQSLRTST
jgi:hypothetical protein